MTDNGPDFPDRRLSSLSPSRRQSAQIEPDTSKIASVEFDSQFLKVISDGNDQPGANSWISASGVSKRK